LNSVSNTYSARKSRPETETSQSNPSSVQVKKWNCTTPYSTTKSNVSISDICHVVNWKRLETAKVCSKIFFQSLTTRHNCVMSECLVQRGLRV